MIFDHRRCALGEGPLWHPMREQLFWFDILGKKLLTQTASGPQEWQFAEHVSAAGWVDTDTLLIASETALIRFTIATGAQSRLCGLEADTPKNRSNDGRADPFGGFWIGTMSKTQTAGAGAIYRYYKGELRLLFKEITISNAICFPPNGAFAHFSDTVTGRVMRVTLDADGWPNARPDVFLDLSAEGLNPDGAVIDSAGVMWLAQWGASRVAAYAPDGQFLRAIPFDAPHTSCPAFGGRGNTTLFCTTALEGMSATAQANHPNAGKTFAMPDVAKGQYEHQVTL